MEIIRHIKSIINEFDSNAVDTLNEIKKVISKSEKPDFSQIKDGERFMYHGIEFVRLGLEQGGILCMTTKPIFKEAFDNDCYNNWAKSSIRKNLNAVFLPLMDENDLLPFESDLTADNGDTAYGKCVGKIGILSCDLYRKYRNIVPLFDEWMWTCTPWHCDAHNYGNARGVRLVGSDGTVYNHSAYVAYGLAPACIFRI